MDGLTSACEAIQRRTNPIVDTHPPSPWGSVQRWPPVSSITLLPSSTPIQSSHSVPRFAFSPPLPLSLPILSTHPLPLQQPPQLTAAHRSAPPSRRTEQTAATCNDDPIVAYEVSAAYTCSVHMQLDSTRIECGCSAPMVPPWLKPLWTSDSIQCVSLLPIVVLSACHGSLRKTAKKVECCVTSDSQLRSSVVYSSTVPLLTPPVCVPSCAKNRSHLFAGRRSVFWRWPMADTRRRGTHGRSVSVAVKLPNLARPTMCAPPILHSELLGALSALTTCAERRATHPSPPNHFSDPFLLCLFLCLPSTPPFPFTSFHRFPSAFARRGSDGGGMSKKFCFV
jgi:hypothetical protein